MFISFKEQCQICLHNLTALWDVWIFSSNALKYVCVFALSVIHVLNYKADCSSWNVVQNMNKDNSVC